MVDPGNKCWRGWFCPAWRPSPGGALEALIWQGLEGPGTMLERLVLSLPASVCSEIVDFVDCCQLGSDDLGFSA